MALARVQGSAKKSFLGQSDSANASITMPSVAAGSLLVALVSVARFSTPSLGLLNTPSDDKGNTWASAVSKSKVSESGSTHQTGSYIFYAKNAASGTTVVTLDCVNETGDNYITWSVEEWSGADTTSPLDKTTTGEAPNNGTGTSISSTGALSQADEVAFALISSQFIWSFDTSPSGYTQIHEETGTVSLNLMCSQASYQVVSATTALAPSWTHNTAGQGATAVLATFKQAAASTSKRVRVSGWNTGETPSGKSNFNAYVWTGKPSAAAATEYGTAACTVSGSDLLLTPAPTGAAANQEVNVMVHQPAGSYASVGFIKGVVEEY